MPLPRRIADALGPDSWLVRHLRPAREWLLRARYGRSGMPRVVVIEMEQVLSDHRLRAVPLSGQADPLGDYGHVALEPEPR